LPLTNNEMKKILFVFFALSIVLNVGSAAQRTTFFSHGPSVAAYGRGETSCAQCDDASSAFYNPSLLSRLNTNNAVFSHFLLFDGTNYSNLSTALILSESVRAGLMLSNLSSGDIELRQNINDVPRIIKTNTYLGSASVAYKIKELYSLETGCSLKYFYLDFVDKKAGSVGLDMGLSKSFSGPAVFGNLSTISVGASVANLLEPTIKLVSVNERYPQIYRAGFVFSFPVLQKVFNSDTLAFSCDVKNEEQKSSFAIGSEYKFLESFLLRCGINENRINAGFGYNIGFMQFNYAIDFLEYAAFNRFGVTVLWGSKEKKKSKKKYKKDTQLYEEAQSAYKEAQEIENARKTEMEKLFNQAKADYHTEQYLDADEKFCSLLLEYSECAPAREINQNIVNTMEQDAKYDGSNLEKISYAEGFIAYKTGDYRTALSQWNKTLEINNKRVELNKYIEIAKKHLSDMQLAQQEAHEQAQTNSLYKQGEEHFANKEFVLCVKKMEELIVYCKTLKGNIALIWQDKASALLKKSIEELSKTIPQQKTRKKQDMADVPKTEQVVVNVAEADKKYKEGLIMYAQGKASEAIRLWEITLRLNPAHEKATKALERVKKELN